MVTDSHGFNHTLHGRRRPSAPHLAMLVVLGLMALPAGAWADSFTVNSMDDGTDANPGDHMCATAAGACTLRAAIQESNALAGLDTITIPSGTYILTIGGRGEDDAATGDLDISDDLNLIGSSTGPTTIDGNNLDRVFDVIGPAAVSMTHLVIRGGQALADSGGAIRNDATLTLTQMAVVSNHADKDGGAIANFATGEVDLTNVTVSGNTAASGGGAISNLEGTVGLTNVTITGNSAGSGGGIRNLSVVHMVNSIVAKNPQGGNCAGSQVGSQGFNLEDGNTCLLDASGDIPNTDPKFAGPLLDNGGYTLTVALTRSSPAVDAGDNSKCPGLDQRGFPRPIDGNGDGLVTCDIGALEIQPDVTPSPTPTSTGPPTSTPTMTTTPLPTGTALPTATPTSTATPRGPTIIVGMVSGYQGDRVTFSVSLYTAGEEIGSEQSDIGFDPDNAPIAALPDGTPDCTINSSLGKTPSFSFRSFAGCQHGCSCTGTQCAAIRAAVFSLSSPVPPLPDGEVLYSCRVNIPASAVPGSYPLSQSAIVMGDLEGKPVTGSGGIDGAVVVLVPPTPTPTPTLTATPTVTSTVTPTSTSTATASPTPTNTPIACVGDCDGSGEVTVDEIITMVNIDLGSAALSKCFAGDSDHSGEITIDEILRAVNNALGSCVALPTN